MTAQSCGKWNKQQNHFLTNFFFYLTCEAQGIKWKRIIILLFCKSTHRIALDLGLLWLFCSWTVWPLLLISTLPISSSDSSQKQTWHLRSPICPSLYKPDALTHFHYINYYFFLNDSRFYFLILISCLNTWSTFPPLCAQLELHCSLLGASTLTCSK